MNDRVYDACVQSLLFLVNIVVLEATFRADKWAGDACLRRLFRARTARFRVVLWIFALFGPRRHPVCPVLFIESRHVLANDRSGAEVKIVQHRLVEARCGNWTRFIGLLLFENQTLRAAFICLLGVTSCDSWIELPVQNVQMSVIIMFDWIESTCAVRINVSKAFGVLRKLLLNSIINNYLYQLQAGG